MKTLAILLTLLATSSATAFAATESEVTDEYCQGIREYTLPDRTRVDCLLDYYAVEYDWPTKWYEAIGQSLYYAMHTGRRAGVVLILKSPDDIKYVERANRTILHYNLPVTLWYINTDGQLIGAL